MDEEAEIISLAGETLALQILLTNVLRALATGGLDGNVRGAFKSAAEELDRSAQEHEAENAAQFRKAKAVMEQLHDGCFGKTPTRN